MPPACVLIIIAMEAEAKPIIEALGLKLDDPAPIVGPAPCHTYSGEYAGMKVHIACNGTCATHGIDLVGTVPASITTYVAAQAFKPDIILSAGTAGGFAAKGGAVGDVYVSTAHCNHDRRIPLPGFDKYGIDMVQAPAAPNLAKELGLKQGVVSTGNSLDYTDKCLEHMKENDASVKEMEASAVQWVAGLFSKPLLCIKAITDIVDGPHVVGEEFLANLAKAAAALKEKVPQVLTYLSTHEVDAL